MRPLFEMLNPVRSHHGTSHNQDWRDASCDSRYRAAFVGMDPDHVEAFPDPFGWRVIEHIGYQELVDRYATPTGRELASTPVERIVYAEKL